MNSIFFKMTFVLSLIIAASACTKAHGENAVDDMPALNKIQSYRLDRPYSCTGDEPLSYEKSAIFLSRAAKENNSPDLLYNGACNSPPYIEASTAGDDLSMISDLGDVPIEEVSAKKAINLKWTVGADNLFQATMRLKANHTYAVMVNKSDIRALYVVHVDSLTQNGTLVLSLAVKLYQRNIGRSASPGFGWEKPSVR